MKIIGRRDETRELLRCEKSKKSELICVYGRRRVGKTFLVEQTFNTNIAFRATGVEKGSTREQLKAFHQRLKEHGDETRTIPNDWFEAFSRLDAILMRSDVVLSPNNKKIVFLDEFPWFATPRSGFLMAFSEFWNRRGTESGDYMFIICGSATSWIIENVLQDTGSLFHRVTCQIFLAPFTLRESEEFFIDRDFGWSRSQILECQMIFGGLPFFMDLLNKDISLRQNVDYLIFKPGALLRDESNRLLEATLKKSDAYEKILSNLSKHRYGIKESECQKILGLANGTFGRAIEDLKKCRYISEYKNTAEKGNPTYIRLDDPFLLFHYHFLSEHSSVDTYSELSQKEGLYSNWRGYAFEIICYHHICQIKSVLGIAGVKTKIFPWAIHSQSGGVQIDMVIDRADKVTNLCEMKCTDRPFTVTGDYESNLLKKRETYRENTDTNSALSIVLISAEGISGTAHTENIADVITKDDLFL